MGDFKLQEKNLKGMEEFNLIISLRHLSLLTTMILNYYTIKWTQRAKIHSDGNTSKMGLKNGSSELLKSRLTSDSWSSPIQTIAAT